MKHRILTILIVFSGLAYFTPSQSFLGIPCVMPGCPDGCYDPPNRGSLIEMLATERSPIPSSLLDKSFYHSIPKTENGEDISCGVNAMCASFPEPQNDDVTGWIGFEYQVEDELLFFATSGEEAFQVDETTYALPLWDRKHFWIQVNENSSPMAIQPRYAATDIMTGYEIYVVDYIGYKIQGVDYTDFQFGMSLSSLVIVVDPIEGTIEDLYVDYYTDDDYIAAIDINKGDQLTTLFLGLDKLTPNTVTFFNIEDPITVTQDPELFLEEWYPGTTFPCTHCGELDLSQVSFKYMFESSLNSFPRTNFTDPLPIIDEIVFRNSFE